MRLERAVPNLSVLDVPAAIRRYTALLDVAVLMDHGWIATLGTPGSPAQFSLMRQDRTATVDPALSLEVDDVDAAYAEARRLGLEIVHELVDEEWGVRRFFFRDPDGVVVNVLAHAG